MHHDEGWTHLRDIEGSLSAHLAGRTVVIGVCASVAALEVHRLARTLMRHGARVQFFLTPAACSLVSPTSLEWCSGASVVSELTGRCEHLEFFGQHGKAALLLIAPATANTVGKIAYGLDDNALTTAVTTALGSGIPVLCCPGMHEPMMANPAVARNLQSLRETGIEILEPTLSEGKAKMMDTAQIVARVLRRLGPNTLGGRRVLLTGGPTREYLDPARCLTNPSSGVSACLLADEAYRRGAEVTLVYGPGQASPPSWLEVLRVETGEQMGAAALSVLQGKPAADFILAVAAVADFQPIERAAEKLSTAGNDELSLKLRPTPKILGQMRSCSPATTLVAFKASSHTDRGPMVQEANVYLDTGKADWVVANSVVIPGLGFEAEQNRYLLCRAKGEPLSLGPAPKARLAVLLWDALLG